MTALVAPKFKVDEVFTEFRVPLLKEKTAAQELTLNLAARYADYNGATGGVLAYNGGIEYAPIDGLRFRAGLARAVRAPSLADLYSAQGQNFNAAPLDPCSLDNRGNGSPTRAANCAAAGVPADYNFTYLSSIEIVSGGNPDLKEETSDSFTAGVVWQPSFAPGFTLSADYFDITIDDVITAPSAQDIMDACYDAPDLNNQFCGLFTRNGAAAGPVGEVPYQILQGSLLQLSLNYASSKARGVDIEAGFSHDIGETGKLSTRLVWTHMLQRDDFLNPAAPGQADQILMELGDPKDAFNLNTDFAFGKLKFGYQMRYIGKQVLNFYEDTFGLQGNPPTNADYAEVRYYGEVFYHDVRAALRHQRLDQRLPGCRQPDQPDPAVWPDRNRRGQRHLRSERPVRLRGRDGGSSDELIPLRRSLPATKKAARKGGLFSSWFRASYGSLTTSPMKAVPPVTLPAPHWYSVSLENSHVLVVAADVDDRVAADALRVLRERDHRRQERPVAAFLVRLVEEVGLLVGARRAELGGRLRVFLRRRRTA